MQEKGGEGDGGASPGLHSTGKGPSACGQLTFAYKGLSVCGWEAK